MVTHLSLERDLGDHERGIGYDVVLGLEAAVATRGLAPLQLDRSLLQQLRQVIANRESVRLRDQRLPGSVGLTVAHHDLTGARGRRDGHI